MTLSTTFAAERRAAVLLLLSAGACYRSISCPRGAQQQTRRRPLLRSIDGTDRQTDGQTNARLFHRSRSMHRLCTCGHWAVSINTHSVLQKPNTMTRVSLDIILQQISVDQQIMFFGCPSSSDCRSKRLRVISLCRTLVLLPHCILNSAVRCYGCPCTY